MVWLDEFFGCRESDGPGDLLIRWVNGELSPDQSNALSVIAWGAFFILLVLLIPRSPKEGDKN